METATQPRLPRAQRREQIIAAATRAFAAEGFAGTGLDGIAAEAGVSRAILYRHFESKTDLYRVVLDRVCERLGAVVGERPGGFTEAAVDGLIAGAAADPDGFRLLFQHVAREPEFRDFADRFSTGMTSAAYQQIAAVVPDPAWARWAARLAPIVAIESVIAWLDAGQPDADTASERVMQAVGGIIAAAQRRPD
ncbi:TetR/AcrR family transcriptional regulator [Jiangella gansuensis]|uniref:TetR/AcrR family transcriptional regulator n=1 Tax=Jiangella gansuensis TaxID=281473 RepID=UPI00047A2F38|nr:TetR/AcrR family transcriptional regulator [Jiangella gansuensis]